MPQGVLPLKYEEETNDTGTTALAGLPLYMDLAEVIGLSKSIQKHLNVRKVGQGWTDSQVIISLVLLNLAGGDCVDDLKVLEYGKDASRSKRKPGTIEKQLRIRGKAIKVVVVESRTRWNNEKVWLIIHVGDTRER